jgi:hypothetical protein
MAKKKPDVKEKDRQTIQWQKDNQKSQRTDRQYNGKKITRSHREGQTDNTMVKR